MQDALPRGPQGAGGGWVGLWVVKKRDRVLEDHFSAWVLLVVLTHTRPLSGVLQQESGPAFPMRSVTILLLQAPPDPLWDPSFP